MYIKNSRFETALDTSGTIYVPSKDGTEVYVFDREGYHLQTLDALSGTVRYTFDYDLTCTETINGNSYDTRAVSSITDRFGRTTTITRDVDCAATAITSPNGVVTYLQTDAQGNLSSVSEPNSASVRHAMTYYSDQKGLLQSIIDPKEGVKRVYYTDEGMFEREIDALGYQKTLLQSSSNPAVKMFFSAEGIKTEYKTTDNGKEVTFADGTKNVQEHKDGGDVVTYADGTKVTTKKTMDDRLGGSAEHVTSHTVATGDIDAYTMTVDREVDMTDTDEVPDDDVPLVFKFDKITDTVVKNGRTNTVTLTNNYDGTYTEEYLAPAPAQHTRSFTALFDDKGRLLERSSSGVTEPVEFAYYDAVNDPEGAKYKIGAITQGTENDTRRKILVTYYNETNSGTGAFKGAVSSVSRLVDVDGSTEKFLTTLYYYDSHGWGSSITELDENDDPIGTIEYGYDANGNVISVTPMNDVDHFFFYNALDRADYYQPPAISGVQMKTHYAYDKDGRVSDIIKPDDKWIHFRYATMSDGYTGNDLTGKLQAVLVDNVEKVTYTYESTGGKKLSTITTADDTSTLTYGYNGALLASEAWSGAVIGTVTRTYNTDFKVTKLTVAGTEIDYTYTSDPAGLLTVAEDLSIGRDEDTGRVTTTTLGSVGTEISYDADYGDLYSYDISGSATDYGYAIDERDNLGRITERTESIGGTPTTYTYTYDEAGRLESVYDGTTTKSYEYDENGNRETYLENSTPVATATYDDQDRMLTYGSNTYTYTLNGDLYTKVAGGNTTTYTHDPFGNLTSVTLPNSTVISYVYDGRNRLLARKTNGTVDYKLIYAGQLAPVAKLDGNNSVLETYVYATGSNSPDYIINGGVNYRVVKDHLGSMRMIVRATDGAVVKSVKYDEFGKVLTESGAFDTIFGFAGGIRDTDTGLTKFGARWYDPETGRWLEKEP
ncbi:MAG TPA: RHS repeat-associated core domain-containing protein, partial [bacterium]|nr:RHS repeat-associated core domain-containing protein [bacterium]